MELSKSWDFFVDFTLSYYPVLKGAALGEENKKKGLKPATFEAAYSSVTVRNGEKFSKYCIIGLKLLQIQIQFVLPNCECSAQSFRSLISIKTYLNKDSSLNISLKELLLKTTLAY